MRDLLLYSACSLDHFIARKDGSIDWLFTDQDYGYAHFYTGIDTTLMGHETYKKVLSFGIDFPYKGKKNYVFSRNKSLKDNANVNFIGGDIVEFVKELKRQEGQDIWLIGGGQLNSLFLNVGLVDKIMLYTHPILLGEGIPLLPIIEKEVNLKLIINKGFESGLVEQHFEVMRE